MGESDRGESDRGESDRGVTLRRDPGRLKKRAEFLRVAAKGRKAPVRGLVLQALARQDEAPARLGFTVTRKVGNAVTRNRTRRRLKEAARLLLRGQDLRGLDLVLIGRDATRGRPFALLMDDLRRALRAAGCALPEKPPEAENDTLKRD